MNKTLTKDKQSDKPIKSLPRYSDSQLPYLESHLTEKELELFHKFEFLGALFDQGPGPDINFKIDTPPIGEYLDYKSYVFECKEIEAKVILFHTIEFYHWKDGLAAGTKAVSPSFRHVIIFKEKYILELDRNTHLDEYEFRYDPTQDLENEWRVYNLEFLDLFIKHYKDFCYHYEIPKDFKLLGSKLRLIEFIRDFQSGKFKKRKKELVRVKS